MNSASTLAADDAENDLPLARRASGKGTGVKVELTTASSVHVKKEIVSPVEPPEETACTPVRQTSKVDKELDTSSTTGNSLDDSSDKSEQSWSWGRNQTWDWSWYGAWQEKPWWNTTAEWNWDWDSKTTAKRQLSFGSYPSWSPETETRALLNRMDTIDRISDTSKIAEKVEIPAMPQDRHVQVPWLPVLFEFM